MRKSGLPPVVDEDTEILILGTLPSDMSIAAGQYYANPGNDFWKIIAGVLNRAFEGLSYEEKVGVLKTNRIGLWDAYHSCIRPGSMDSGITKQELNDFQTLKGIAPNIRLICFNGRKAAEAEESLDLLGYKTLLLPSSSGANRKNHAVRLSRWKEGSSRICPTWSWKNPSPKSSGSERLNANFVCATTCRLPGTRLLRRKAPTQSSANSILSQHGRKPH